MALAESMLVKILGPERRTLGGLAACLTGDVKSVRLGYSATLTLRLDVGLQLCGSATRPRDGQAFPR